MATLLNPPAAAPAQAPALDRRSDDKQLLRLAAGLTRELSKPDPRIYWADFLLSAAIGYAGLAVAIAASDGWVMAAGWLAALLLLYRAGLFIHEITHVNHRDLPGFRLVWNMLLGVPLMVPSFLYEGIHNLHHAKTRYGTQDDPEYLPLALMKPWTLPLFIAVAALAPLGQFLRFGILAPLSLVIPPLRRIVVEKYSGLQINPGFRRRPAEGDLARAWRWQEVATSLWALLLLAGVFTGFLPLRGFLIYLSVVSGVVLLNQVRTIVAHLWENDWSVDGGKGVGGQGGGGQEMSVTAQYLDSVNVVSRSFLPELWAPVGLRWHALHHLLPSVPYHNLPAAHQRLMAELAPDSAYHRANYSGLPGLVASLLRKTMGR